MTPILHISHVRGKCEPLMTSGAIYTWCTSVYIGAHSNVHGQYTRDEWPDVLRPLRSADGNAATCSINVFSTREKNGAKGTTTTHLDLKLKAAEVIAVHFLHPCLLLSR